MDILKIGTFNVRGLRDHSKRKEIFQYLKDCNFDIVLLQETHSRKNDEYFWRTRFGGKMFFSHGTTQSCGVAIVINLNSNVKIVKSQRDKDGRWIYIDTLIGGGKM